MELKLFRPTTSNVFVRNLDLIFILSKLKLHSYKRRACTKGIIINRAYFILLMFECGVDKSLLSHETMNASLSSLLTVAGICYLRLLVVPDQLCFSLLI